MTTHRISAALATFALLAGLAVSTAGAERLPAATAYNVRESYRLLSTSYYKPVEDTVLLEGALDGLAIAAHKKGIRLALPDLHRLSRGAALDVLDDAIASAAVSLHVTPTDASYFAIAGMAKSVGDKYTQFFTPDELKQFDEALDPEKISGIGVIVAPDVATGFIQAAYVVPGTPADRAGIQSGDDLVSVDGISTKGMVQEGVTKILRGRTGTVARVGTARAGKTLVPLSIVRAQVSPPTVIYRMLPDKVAYLAIFAFGQETPDQFSAALERVRSLGAQALVVDLRNNGGGYVRSAVLIAQHFIANKPLLTVEQRGLAAQTIDAEDESTVTLPMTVLVNQYSASASEIAAGALQDDGAALLVGNKTFGKGVMQDVTRLSDGSAIKITIAHYLTPANRDINLKGIVPDVVVDENKDARFGDPLHDAQLRAALTVLQRKLALKTP
ncbi:MAG: S41 family peptidase [Candidatus Eremiobacteraeota bacterium]|nr:S41 family peptidase [Candidatus Eremiobacteraeota bacterium]